MLSNPNPNFPITKLSTGISACKEPEVPIRMIFKEVSLSFGVLVFKWNECQIKVNDILALTDKKPLIGHKSGKRMDTHWILFLKVPDENN